MVELIGQRFGNYTLVRLLGEGAFAQVYEGRHQHLDKSAAIKVLKTSLSENEEQNFQEEARKISNLDHPHIIRVEDFGVERHIPYMIMQYAYNGSLRQQYPLGARLPQDLIVTYSKEIADALSYAHERDIIHRDIKPANLLLGEKKQILLCDFGVAVVIRTQDYQRSLETLTMAGTPSYMAPEQARGEPVKASDQYSLAVMVYEWLCGVPPFQGSFVQLLHQHQETSPPSLQKKVSGISPEIERVLFKALAKKPEHRFSDVQAFALSLERACNAGSPTLISPTDPPRLPEWRRPATRRWFLLTLGSCVAGAVVGSSVTYFFSHSGGSSSNPTLSQVPTPSTQPVLAIPRLMTTYKGHTGEVDSVAWSPNDQSIASGSRDQQVHVWDAATGNHFYSFKNHTDWVFDAAWSLNGQRVASASVDETVKIWDATTGGNALTYTGHKAAVISLAWSPNGNNIASTSSDKTVQVWDAKTLAPRLTYSGHTDEVRAVSYSLGGKYLASGGVDQIVQVWDATNGTTILSYKGHTDLIDTVAWSPNAQYIASGGRDTTVQIWDANTGKLITLYKDHSDRVRRAAWSPDGTLIASASADYTVQVWNPFTGTMLFNYRHTNWVHSVAWSPDGKFLASASADYTVQVWQMR
jgi:eukaryotic-like serine/threonine-protein kinase